MARSFYDDNRRVSVDKLRRELGYRWLYPTYREGLGALAAAGEGRRAGALSARYFGRAELEKRQRGA